jgi:hypothetical protein
VRTQNAKISATARLDLKQAKGTAQFFGDS